MPFFLFSHYFLFVFFVLLDYPHTTHYTEHSPASESYNNSSNHYTHTFSSEAVKTAHGSCSQQCHCTQLSIDFSDSPGELLRNQTVASTAPEAITRQQEQFLSILFHILHLKSLNMYSEKERKKRFKLNSINWSLTHISIAGKH